MSSPAFTLSVPADEPFRGLAADCVRAYFVATSPGTDVSGFVSQVADVVTRLAAAGTDVEVELRAQPADVEVRVRCGGATETLTHSVPAGGN
jgi:hypothetical protein